MEQTSRPREEFQPRHEERWIRERAILWSSIGVDEPWADRGGFGMSLEIGEEGWQRIGEELGIGIKEQEVRAVGLRCTDVRGGGEPAIHALRQQARGGTAGARLVKSAIGRSVVDHDDLGRRGARVRRARVFFDRSQAASDEPFRLIGHDDDGDVQAVPCGLAAGACEGW